MDFVIGLPRTSKGYDWSWIIVEHLSKMRHILLMKTTYSATQYVKLYIERVVFFRGVALFIIYNWRP